MAGGDISASHRCFRPVSRTGASAFLAKAPTTWPVAGQNSRMARDGRGLRKRHGRHYTPVELAGFLAGRVAVHLPERTSLRVLDPACGDGELLFAVGSALAARYPDAAIESVGYDLDPAALGLARERAVERGVDVEWREGNFLLECADLPDGAVDVVITNPPYVRAQQLGGSAAQELSRRFGLRGRIDLTHPFVAALPRLMRPGAVLGLLCANRFLTTKAGANLRAVLLDELEPVELYDLGDTRLFEAAVLPAVTIATRTWARGICRYTSAYQIADEPAAQRLLLDEVVPRAEHDQRAISLPGPTDPAAPALSTMGDGAPVVGSGRPAVARADDGDDAAAPPEPAGGYVSVSETVAGGELGCDVQVDGAARCTAEPAGADLFRALSHGRDMVVEHRGRRFAVESGLLDAGGTALPTPAWRSVWRMSRDNRDAWLARIEEATWCTFGDVGRIRVGIKTTADQVFIADQWDESAPEPELLHTLITHDDLAPWRIARTRSTRVLYPYDTTQPRRTPIDLARYPRAAAYLTTYRERLAGRRYVTAAGREWFEIWVPQRPNLWQAPKIVFPDISVEPKFALDRSGAVVNGDCYWISLADLGAPGEYGEDLAYLLMGVANSSLGIRFYDAVCGNRLYAGRRRWITQYVSRFPLPDPDTAAARAIVAWVRGVVDDAAPAGNAPAAPESAALDDLVDAAFVLD